MTKWQWFWKVLMWIDIVSMLAGLTYSVVLIVVKHTTTFVCPAWLVILISILGIITGIIAIDRTDREM